MSPTELAAVLEHSVLKPEATERDVAAGADIVRERGIGFYCVQPFWVARAARALEGANARVVSVIGFPHGCDPTAAKVEAARAAIADGAHELDMVMNVGALRSGLSADVASDIAAVVAAAPRVPVKVILETAVLSYEEKRLACRVAIASGAAFLKTSTGFHPAGGATVADVRLLREIAGATVGVKAAGGIRTLADAQAMIEAGANRIGTSSSAAILDALGSLKR
jgi:deoxyribose-phosphate aldolase